jgi:tetraacyldisaccharide 4'-kinase
MPLIPSPAELHDLVSGKSKGLRATLFRALLATLEPCYYLATAFRNRRYDRSPKLVTKVGIPVISVGNLTVGGTGKTPVVLWIAQRLREKDLRVAIISRGYGAESSRNDEAMELEARLPDVPHVQHADRIIGAQIAIEELESQVIVLDDAFQHRRIARDLDIVLIDALCPFGYGHLLPRGLLRESLGGLRRAQAVILTRSDLVSQTEKSRIESAVLKINSQLIWTEASHSPSQLPSASGIVRELTSVVGLPVAAFCGIGNPDGFRQTLEKCGANIASFRAFPDHHSYSAEDVASLGDWAKSTCAKAILCTQKDLVKLQVDDLGGIPLFALQIDIRFQRGESELLAVIDQIAAEASRL